MYDYRVWLFTAPLLFLLVQLFSGVQAKVPAIIVFGDSSVDAGNNNQIPTVARSNFGPYGRDFEGGRATGRFSNGRIPTDFISESFGLRPTVPAYLDPSYNISDFAVGVSFASAGSGYDNATSDVLRVIPLWKELEYYKQYQKKLREYLGDEKAEEIIEEALYVTSMGTNDFLENYYAIPGGRQSQFTIDEYQDFLAGIARKFVTDLYGLGARKISLGGVPPMGCMPLERTTNFADGQRCIKSYNDIAFSFNGKLKSLTVELNNQLPGLQLVNSNPYGILMQIIRKPSLYGFEAVGVACCATGMFEMGYGCDQYNPLTCKDAKKYVFWDAFHPTEKTNQIIVDHLMKTTLLKFL
ncbi:PREDICTED: GDSL esterase/lipase At2g04570-like [Ipomoea nil]|uniref:GDSL esterase/lipase At2g04570-like n=1 Tax=Ipomoea nil TaxID=35883 RepID=UPI000900C873|nr:PREDICTED: GDSL esterase/lipase At2g04570-like [Ipomoea nil]XP_019162664.1 PREDICTED: GDSL esterase/lipase At2g04570-like [Ipomoea nil]